MFNKLIPLKCYWDTTQRKMLCCWLLNSHKYYQNIDSVVVVKMKTCYRTVIVVIYWVVVGNLSLISEAECCYISTFLMCDVCWSKMLFKKAVNIEVCNINKIPRTTFFCNYYFFFKQKDGIIQSFRYKT